MKILAIETSCDDTSISISSNYKILSLVTFSQLKQHNKTGGVIPEIASRMHSDEIFDLIKLSLKEANLSFEDIEAIAVTKGPGLVNSLQVGITVAKSLSQILNIPLYGINHLDAHAFSSFIDLQFDFNLLSKKTLAVILSGGHSIFALVDQKLNFKIIGQTLDDSIGEAYDKVSKMLGYQYPGGPIIDQIHSNYKSNDLTKLPIFKTNEYDVSFSGIKSHISNLIKNKNINKKNLAASFQETSINQINNIILKIINDFKIENILVGGGVSSNSYLQTKLNEIEKVKVYIPDKKYATDNAAMIAYLAFLKITNKIKVDDLQLDANPNLNLGE